MLLEYHNMNRGQMANSFERAWRKRFEGFATYSEDDAGIAGWSPTGLATRLRQFTSRWEKASSKSGLWLDAGCGAGTYSRFMARQGTKVIGADYSLLSLQKAKARGDDDVSWCKADVNHLPIKAGCCDGVICFGVTQALEDSVTVTQELSNVVRPGGQVWVDALNGLCLPHILERFLRWVRGRPMHLRYESHRDMKALMRNAKLINIKLYWLPILPSRWSQYQWLVENRLAEWVFNYVPFAGTLFCHAFILYGERSSND